MGNREFKSQYEKGESIGKGGQGEVFKCRNKLDGLYYAVKFLKLDDLPVNGS